MRRWVEMNFNQLCNCFSILCMLQKISCDCMILKHTKQQEKNWVAIRINVDVIQKKKKSKVRFSAQFTYICIFLMGLLVILIWIGIILYRNLWHILSIFFHIPCVLFNLSKSPFINFDKNANIHAYGWINNE